MCFEDCRLGQSFVMFIVVSIIRFVLMIILRTALVSYIAVMQFRRCPSTRLSSTSSDCSV